jgi:hypothetical protein
LEPAHLHTVFLASVITTSRSLSSTAVRIEIANESMTTDDMYSTNRLRTTR